MPANACAHAHHMRTHAVTVAERSRTCNGEKPTAVAQVWNRSIKMGQGSIPVGFLVRYVIGQRQKGTQREPLAQA
jgi:hypothetical protein